MELECSQLILEPAEFTANLVERVLIVFLRRHLGELGIFNNPGLEPLEPGDYAFERRSLATEGLRFLLVLPDFRLSKLSLQLFEPIFPLSE